MKLFLTMLAAVVMCSCLTESAEAQNCNNGYGGGFYSARPVVAVGYAPRGGYGYRGYPAARSSSFYRGVNVGSRYIGPSFYRGGYGGRYGGFGGYGGRYGGFGYGGRGISVGRGISIGIGF